MYHLILYFHILAGTIALITGLIAILAAKGRRHHNRAGSLFYFAMFGVGISAITLSLLKFNSFLLAIGIFTLYMNYAGKQALYYFRLRENHRPGWADWSPAGAGLLTSIFMLGFPVWQMWQQQHFSVPVLAVFGSILLVTSLRDLRTLQNPELFRPGNKTWLLKHISMMGGTYIATITAFLVTSVHISPGWVLWITPTVAGGFLIFRALKTWRSKLKLSAA